MKGYYELKTTEDGKIHFTLHAGNHEIILSSQLYAEKSNAENGIESTRTNGTHEARYERKLSAKGEPYFLLKAPNGQIIGTSEMYGSEATRDNGIRCRGDELPQRHRQGPHRLSHRDSRIAPSPSPRDALVRRSPGVTPERPHDFHHRLGARTSPQFAAAG